MGAWLVAKCLIQHHEASRIVPEGFEDIHIEGPDPVFVQVKSRQEQVGDFTVGKVAAFIREMWDKRVRRLQEGVSDGRLLLVLERAVAGHQFGSWREPLADLDPHNALRVSLPRIFEEDELQEVLKVSSILVLPWEEASDGVAEAVVASFDSMPAGARLVERELRLAVANAADRNTAADGPQTAAGIDPLMTHALISQVLELVDREALQAALSDGTCEIVDFRITANDDGYFEGLAAQPGHIAAGVPAPRPILTGQVIQALADRQSVLLAGPSGVGKSTVLWAAIYTRRDMIWYRVNRLDSTSVTKLVRLARASRSSDRSQVGFVVDGVGIGEAQAWDQLSRALAPQNGVLLIGSVRREDMFSLTSLADSAIIEVSLDEEVAQAIYSKLRLEGATQARHWREHFMAANGLTMEYTYLLTHGARLVDVLTAQVRRRVQEGREVELRLLAIVTTAHQWGVQVPVSALTGAEFDESALRPALARLQDEHLLLSTTTMVSGLHALRSRTLSTAVHSFPPPTIESTIVRLLQVVPPNSIPALVSGAIRDYPHLQDEIVRSLVSRTAHGDAEQTVVAVARALRFVELEKRSREWVAIMDRLEVPIPSRPVTLQLALLEDPQNDNTLTHFPESIQSAVSELSLNARQPFRLLDSFVQTLGVDEVCLAITHCSDPATAANLISSLSGLGEATVEAISSGIRTHSSLSSLETLLHGSGAEAAGNIILAGTRLGPPVADALLELAGGTDVLLTKITDECVWLTEIRIQEDHATSVVWGRTLHISDDLQGNAETYVRELARIALSCLPMCETADIQALLPGGNPIVMGDFTFGVSKLNRRYVHDPGEIDLNRRTAAIACAAFQTGTRTDRIAEALEHLPAADEYLERLSRIWILGRSASRETSRTDALREELRQYASTMSKVSGTDDFLRDEVEATGNDYLHTLVSGIVDNLSPRLARPDGNLAPLALYVDDTLRKAVREVQREAWDLLDAAVPAELTSIDKRLTDLHAILSEIAFGNTPSRQLVTAARSGPSSSAVRRAADLAARNARRRHEREWNQRAQTLRSLGHEVTLYSRPVQNEGSHLWPPVEIAVGVNLPRVLDWPETCAHMVAALTPPGNVQSFQPPLVIFPTIDNRRVDELAIKVISSVHPYPGLRVDWTEGLPESAHTHLAEVVTRAHQSLQVLSGLAELAGHRDISRLQDPYDDALKQYSESIKELHSGPDDELTETLVEILNSHAQGVEIELFRATENQRMENSLAQSVTSLLGPEPSSEALELAAMRYFALQGDLNRAVALQDLSQLKAM
ncbi:hypothetical protein J3A64_001781 [Pseudarthrobacter sp. PvP004]|uniref:hypothetical protein n=1 Tax=Pseudarthrobacter sp. PvP004 TaxID=2817850 RepID=UPI001AEA48C7|nr:hypothetical protein [Pseudarthrobacter sp. PvP004]MBP2266317.1 hypothetical protein [Pseudarthrobacter sp. PvP004]